MSGYAQAGIIGESYRLILSGGESSWDYDALGGMDAALSAALDELKPKLDDAFRETAARLGLNIALYGPRKKIKDVNVREIIPNTTYSADLSVMASERIKPDDMNRLLMSLIECIQGSGAMKKLIYDDTDAFPELRNKF